MPHMITSCLICSTRHQLVCRKEHALSHLKGRLAHAHHAVAHDTHARTQIRRAAVHYKRMHQHHVARSAHNLRRYARQRRRITCALASTCISSTDCSVMRYVAVRRSVLQCVAVRGVGEQRNRILCALAMRFHVCVCVCVCCWCRGRVERRGTRGVGVACCSVLQYVAVRRSVLQCVAV